MGRICSIICLFLSLGTAAQVNLQGLVLDAKTKDALPYCAIALKNTVTGCLSNEEGVFQIVARIESDTFLLSYAGYKPKQIPVSQFVKNTTVLLERKENILTEVVVYSNDEFLYTLFTDCRKKLRDSKEIQSKVYFVLESSINGQATELLESYYNGSSNNFSLKNLHFKNGRAGLAAYNERLFINANTSKAFTFLNLLDQNEHLPATPLQYDKRRLKKNYTLKLKSVYDSERPVYCIEFIPNVNDGKSFSGEAWIDKNTSELKKITLTISNTTQHPFLPLFKETGSIKDASMQITRTYQNMGGESKLDHIDFNYQLNYRHVHSAALKNSNKDSSFTLSSKGLMYFYDYEKTFINPYFEYDDDMSDYRKITSLTYNENFWNSNTGLVYSDKMKKGISYFKTNGLLINYKNASAGSFTQGKFFENNYIKWSDKKRLSLKKDNIKNDTSLNKTSNGIDFVANQYHLKAQLFLDLNPMGDSIQHFSASIFDTFDTFYNLPQESFTNCFINIYFDLFEIERRKMEKNLAKKNLSASQIDSIYKLSVLNLETQTSQYLKEVERGKNRKSLEKWNSFVIENIGIDNIQLFELQNKEK